VRERDGAKKSRRIKVWEEGGKVWKEERGEKKEREGIGDDGWGEQGKIMSRGVLGGEGRQRREGGGGEHGNAEERWGGRGERRSGVGRGKEGGKSGVRDEVMEGVKEERGCGEGGRNGRKGWWGGKLVGEKEEGGRRKKRKEKGTGG